MPWRGSLGWSRGIAGAFGGRRFPALADSQSAPANRGRVRDPVQPLGAVPADLPACGRGGLSLLLFGRGERRLLGGLGQFAGQLRSPGSGAVHDGRFGFLGFLIVGHKSSLRARFIGSGPVPIMGAINGSSQISFQQPSGRWISPPAAMSQPSPLLIQFPHGDAGERLPRGFRFQGRYTESDLEALAQFTVSQLLDQRIGRITVSATMLLAVGAVLLRSWPVAIGGFLLILGVSALVRYVLLPGRLLQHARQLPGLLGDRSLAVDGKEPPASMRKAQSQTFPREAIRRLVLHKAHLFILLKPQGCLMLPLAWIQPPHTIEQVVQCLVRRNDD